LSSGSENPVMLCDVVRGFVRVASFVVGVLAAACSAAQPPLEKSYSGFLKNDGNIWCVYEDMAEFESEAAVVVPTTSARVSFVSGVLTELTYQTQPESADWVVVDKYVPSSGDVLLRRANLLASPQLIIMQEARVDDGTVSTFRITSVTTLDGIERELPPTVDFPVVPVIRDLMAIPFMRVVGEIRRDSVGTLCK
jgi:hypothetical protein